MKIHDEDGQELLSKAAVIDYFQISEETYKRWRWGKGGRKPQGFPEPDRVVHGSHFWSIDTLDHWDMNIRSEQSRRWKELQI